MADRKQELRRQLRVVQRNPYLIAALFLLKTGLLQTDDDLDFAAARQLYREHARLRRKLGLSQVTHNSQRERPKEANPTARATGAIARTASPARAASTSGTLLARGNTLL